MRKIDKTVMILFFDEEAHIEILIICKMKKL